MLHAVMANIPPGPVIPVQTFSDVQVRHEMSTACVQALTLLPAGSEFNTVRLTRQFDVEMAPGSSALLFPA